MVKEITHNSMRILVAPDSFKGTFLAKEIANEILQALPAAYQANARIQPLADGGEGTVDVLADALCATRQTQKVTGPLGESVDALFALAGDMALIDGQHGGPNFRTGSWQGYHGFDVEAIIDMGKNSSIRKISANFLQDQRSWIFMPLSASRSLKMYSTAASCSSILAFSSLSGSWGLMAQCTAVHEPIASTPMIGIFHKAL
ncbi:MAG: glycerate kinase [Chlorobiales bacterium]|nr:glycerate kinase [Chlorobiales bacterium]